MCGGACVLHRGGLGNKRLIHIYPCAFTRVVFFTFLKCVFREVGLAGGGTRRPGWRDPAVGGGAEPFQLTLNAPRGG